MGYMRHNAIIVTGFSEDKTQEAHLKAKEIFGELNEFGDPVAEVTEITYPSINGYQSFLIAPDGSKEGWSTSDRGDAARDAFIKWLTEDSPHWFGWAEVQYDDDEKVSKVTRSNDDEEEE